MKRKVLIGNWKMNKTLTDSITFINKVKEVVDELDDHEIVVGVAPSYLCLPVLKKLGGKILSVSQNVHFSEQGAYTGEVSVLMLEEFGIDFSLVGHSERRQYFNETNETCNLKLKILQKHDMTGIYCVGESLKDFESEKTKEVIKIQILEGIEGLSDKYVASLVIAYEPIWAIGTGKSMTPEMADEIGEYIISVISEKYSEEIAEKVYILYGGSVKPENINEYVDKDNIDGVLVGGASLQEDSFLEMIEKLKELV